MGLPYWRGEFVVGSGLDVFELTNIRQPSFRSLSFFFFFCRGHAWLERFQVAWGSQLSWSRLEIIEKAVICSGKIIRNFVQRSQSAACHISLRQLVVVGQRPPFWKLSEGNYKLVPLRVQSINHSFYSTKNKGNCGRALSSSNMPLPYKVDGSHQRIIEISSQLITNTPKHIILMALSHFLSSYKTTMQEAKSTNDIWRNRSEHISGRGHHTVIDTRKYLNEHRCK